MSRPGHARYKGVEKSMEKTWEYSSLRVVFRFIGISRVLSCQVNLIKYGINHYLSFRKHVGNV